MIKKTQQTPKSPEFDFFVKTPLTRYEGQYVAILGKRVIAAGDTAKAVWEKARKKYPKTLPTIAKIPKKEILVLQNRLGTT